MEIVGGLGWGQSGVEAYSGDTLGAVLRKTKKRRNLILVIRTLEGAGVSTDGEIDDIALSQNLR